MVTTSWLAQILSTSDNPAGLGVRYYLHFLYLFECRQPYSARLDVHDPWSHYSAALSYIGFCMIVSICFVCGFF